MTRGKKLGTFCFPSSKHYVCRSRHNGKLVSLNDVSNHLTIVLFNFSELSIICAILLNVNLTSPHNIEDRSKIFLLLKILKLCAETIYWHSCNYFPFVVCELEWKIASDPYLLLAGVESVTSAAELGLFIPLESLAHGLSPFIQWKNTGVSPILQVWLADSRDNTKTFLEKPMPGRQNLTPTIFYTSRVPQKGPYELAQHLTLLWAAQHPLGAGGDVPGWETAPCKKTVA